MNNKPKNDSSIFSITVSEHEDLNVSISNWYYNFILLNKYTHILRDTQLRNGLMLKWYYFSMSLDTITYSSIDICFRVVGFSPNFFIIVFNSSNDSESFALLSVGSYWSSLLPAIISELFADPKHSAKTEFNWMGLCLTSWFVWLFSLKALEQWTL